MTRKGSPLWLARWTRATSSREKLQARAVRGPNLSRLQATICAPSVPARVAAACARLSAVQTVCVVLDICPPLEYPRPGKPVPVSLRAPRGAFPTIFGVLVGKVKRIISRWLPKRLSCCSMRLHGRCAILTRRPPPVHLFAAYSGGGGTFEDPRLHRRSVARPGGAACRCQP